MILTTFLVVGALAVAQASSPDSASIRLLIDDMTLPHVAQPSGVPDSYNWAKFPRVGRGNDPGSWRAFVAWGQVYEASGGSPAENARVAIRNLQAAILSRSTGRWTVVQHARTVEGAAYREDFVDDVSQPADIRLEADGSVAVRLAKRHNYHFWVPSRVEIDPRDIAGVCVWVEARTVVDDPKRPDDRAKARLMMSAGADYWATTTARWDHFKTNGDVGIGRFRWIREDWAWYTMTSLDASRLRANPPPAPRR